MLAKHASSIIETKPLQEKGISSFEKPSPAESLHVPSLDLAVKPSPEPRTLKEGVICPSEFAIEFKDYGNTSNLSWHEKTTFLSKEVSLERNHQKNG
jgi:hypothetical protein